MKRLFDLLASGALLVVLGLPMVVCAGLLVARQGSPVLFRQHRIGRHGHPFTILKFRTMRNGPVPGGAVTSGEVDVRITPLGAILRRYRIDEWPQLFNVIRGEMSLVGPRPEVPEFVDLEDPMWRQVLSVRPGLTGPDALAFRNEGQRLQHAEDAERTYRDEILPEKLRIQAQYARERHFLGDLKVLFRTLGALRG